ncbi:MAG: SDR family oxidoreductase, partial [Acidimicrobiaceae bacterium]|nr:SDR family oxidoreductase [Acidimicrobiaceae bacterium]
VLADWNDAALQHEAARLGDATLAQHMDVTDRAAWQSAKQAAEKAFGPVEILINNAGLAPGPYELADMPPEHFDQLVAVMVTGMFNGIHTFAGGMRERGEGHILNTSSMAGLGGFPRLGAYSTSKFAIVGMSEVLKAEMEPHGVGVSVLCPGLVRTNLGSSWRRDDRPSPMDAGLDPSIVGAQVVEAIRHNEFYVITHGAHGPAVAARAARLQQAFDAAPQRS